MASFNRVIMIGNLTRDPEYKQLTSGQAVCRLGLASNRQFKNRQNGEMIQEVCFIDIDVWGPQADLCNQYLQKGRSILVEGRLKLDSWQDQDGNRRSKHSIVADRVTFLPSSQHPYNSGESASMSEDSSASEFSSNSFSEPKSSSISEAPKFKPKPRPAQAQTQTSVGEIMFKDQEPFKDDLPF